MNRSLGIALALCCALSLSVFAQEVTLTRVFNTHPTSSGLWWSADVRGNYCYVGNSYGGWRVYNTTNPQNATQVSTFSEFEAGETVFNENLAVFRVCPQGIRVVDVTNPNQPTILGGLDTPGYAEDISCKGNLVAVADRQGGLRLINISNPATPSEYSSVAVGYAYGVALDARMAYVTTSSELVIVNVSVPESPVIVSRLALTSLGRRVCVFSHYVAIANYFSGLTIVDVSTPTAPVVVSNWRLNGVSNAALSDVTVVRNLAYLAYGYGGLVVLNIGNPESPVQLTRYAGSNAVGLSVCENYLYAGDYNLGFSIFRINGITTDVEEAVPSKISLAPCFPNPFNSSTTISYSLPSSSNVKVSIFDATGRLVATPLQDRQPAGQHSLKWDAKGLPSGNYVYRVEANQTASTGMVQLVK